MVSNLRFPAEHLERIFAVLVFVSLEVGLIHGNGVDLVVLRVIEFPRVGDALQPFGIHLYFSRRGFKRVPLRVGSEVGEGGLVIAWVEAPCPNSHLYSLFKCRHAGVHSHRSNHFVPETSFLVGIGTVVGVLVFDAKALGKIGKPFEFASAFPWRLLDLLAIHELLNRCAGLQRCDSHAFLRHDFGKKQIAVFCR